MGRQLAATLLGGGALAAGGRLALRQARLVRAVPPDLRRASLVVPFALPPGPLLGLMSRLPVTPGPVADDVTVSTREIAVAGEDRTVEVFVYEPAGRGRPSPALLWFHGGGHVLGHPGLDHWTCSRLARDLGVLVVSVRYRLGPAHPVPAGLDDAATALRWLRDDAGDLGVDVARVAVGGESAGGGLAAALAQRATDEGAPPAFQLLVYPMLDDRTALDRSRPVTLVWTPRANRVAWTSYLGRRPSPVEDRPYASPARREDLGGLPPAWVCVGTADLFHDEDVDYARRLAQAGVACRLEVVPGMYHGAWSMAETAGAVVELRAGATRALGDALGVTTTPG